MYRIRSRSSAFHNTQAPSGSTAAGSSNNSNDSPSSAPARRKLWCMSLLFLLSGGGETGDLSRRHAWVMGMLGRLEQVLNIYLDVLAEIVEMQEEERAREEAAARGAEGGAGAGCHVRGTGSGHLHGLEVSKCRGISQYYPSFIVIEHSCAFPIIDRPRRTRRSCSRTCSTQRGPPPTCRPGTRPRPTPPIRWCRRWWRRTTRWRARMCGSACRRPWAGRGKDRRLVGALHMTWTIGDGLTSTLSRCIFPTVSNEQGAGGRRRFRRRGPRSAPGGGGADAARHRDLKMTFEWRKWKVESKACTSWMHFVSVCLSLSQWTHNDERKVQM